LTTIEAVAASGRSEDSFIMTLKSCVSGTEISPKVSAILLAGGASRRMGGLNKALLKVGRVTIVERVVHALSGIFPEVMVITNTPDDFAFLGLPMFRDLRRGFGSLGGLYTGLTVSTMDHGFLVACDMPFLSAKAIEHMLALIEDNDVVIPRLSGGLEPLHAVYSRRCVPHIGALLDAGDLKIINVFPHVKVREVPEEDLIRLDPRLLFAMNVNTPEALSNAQALARELDGE
jgi:molybdenum cofactor guanylyltransferase